MLPLNQYKLIKENYEFYYNIIYINIIYYIYILYIIYNIIINMSIYNFIW